MTYRRHGADHAGGPELDLSARGTRPALPGRHARRHNVQAMPVGRTTGSAAHRRLTRSGTTVTTDNRRTICNFFTLLYLRTRLSPTPRDRPRVAVKQPRGCSVTQFCSSFQTYLQHPPPRFSRTALPVQCSRSLPGRPCSIRSGGRFMITLSGSCPASVGSDSGPPVSSRTGSPKPRRTRDSAIFRNFCAFKPAANEKSVQPVPGHAKPVA